MGKKKKTKHRNHLHRMRRENNNSFAMLIGVSVVLFWRGAWGLLDKFFIPHNDTLSYSISTILGLAILYYTHHLTKEFE